MFCFLDPAAGYTSVLSLWKSRAKHTYVPFAVYLLAVYNITFLRTLDADLPYFRIASDIRKLINQNPVLLSLIQNNVPLGFPSFPFLHLWGGGEKASISHFN